MCSSRDGKLHLSRDRTRSYHALLIQDPLHVQGPLQSHRPSDRGTASLSPSHVSLVSHLSLVVTLSHLSLVVTSAESWHVDTTHTLVPYSGFSCYGPTAASLCCLVVSSCGCLAVLPRCLVSFVRERLSPCLVVAVSSSSHCVLARQVILSCLGLVRCLFLTSFLVAPCRCLLLCLPFALLSAALSESAAPYLQLALLCTCWSLFSVVSYSCLVYLSCSFAWVVSICLTVDGL